MFDPDDVHEFFLTVGNILGKYSVSRYITKALFFYKSARLSQNLAGIEFSNPIGLSAGFDKDGLLTEIIADVGFGFESVGTLTPQAYEGNPKPWTRRLKKSKSILVNFGLKNKGISDFIPKHKNLSKTFPYFLSLGKTNCPDTVTLEQGLADYKKGIELFEQTNLGSVYELNISCPNAFGGESFATPQSLKLLLEALSKIKITKPIFVKMPINLAWEEFEQMLDLCVQYKISGVIIGNLNKDRSSTEIRDNLTSDMKGNLSGLPTQKLSNELISKTYAKYHNQLIVVGVGGIFSFEDGLEKIRRGASLIELITGMIFEGPSLISEINQKLDNYIVSKGLKNISELVGEYHKIQGKTDL